MPLRYCRPHRSLLSRTRKARWRNKIVRPGSLYCCCSALTSQIEPALGSNTQLGLRNPPPGCSSHGAPNRRRRGERGVGATAAQQRRQPAAPEVVFGTVARLVWLD